MSLAAGFIYRHWRGGWAPREAFRIGLSYGWSCVGCCWALMLVMFALGLASLPWMLGIAVFMALEKNTALGRRLRIPLGIGLIVLGMAMMLSGTSPSHHSH